jgi:hypothetical protein
MNKEYTEKQKQKIEELQNQAAKAWDVFQKKERKFIREMQKIDPDRSEMSLAEEWFNLGA